MTRLPFWEGNERFRKITVQDCIEDKQTCNLTMNEVWRNWWILQFWPHFTTELTGQSELSKFSSTGDSIMGTVQYLLFQKSCYRILPYTLVREDSLHSREKFRQFFVMILWWNINRWSSDFKPSGQSCVPNCTYSVFKVNGDTCRDLNFEALSRVLETTLPFATYRQHLCSQIN